MFNKIEAISMLRVFGLLSSLKHYETVGTDETKIAIINMCSDSVATISEHKNFNILSVPLKQNQQRKSELTRLLKKEDK
jgi:hypothetical protein